MCNPGNYLRHSIPRAWLHFLRNLIGETGVFTYQYLEVFEQHADTALRTRTQLLSPEQIPVIFIPMRDHSAALSPGGMSHQNVSQSRRRLH